MCKRLPYATIDATRPDRGRRHLASVAVALVATLIGTFSPNVARADTPTPPPVTIDMRMDRPVVHVDPRDDMLAPDAASSRRAYIRVRVEAARPTLADPDTRTALNIALVIDRIAKRDDALDEAIAAAVHELVNDLNTNDIVSIVGYSDVVEVLWPAGPPRTDLGFVGRLAPALPQEPALPLQAPTARANVFGGVAKAAAEIRRFTGPARVNHLILVAAHAPGLGPQRPRDLAQLGIALGRDDIGLTVIDTTARPEAALRALADGASGTHFNANDTTRVRHAIAETVRRLRAVRARDVRLDIAFSAGVTPLRVVGTPGEISRQTLSASLGDLRPPAAFEIIAQLDTARCPVGTRIIADAELRYFDVQLLRNISARSAMTVTCSPGEPHEAHFDYDVVSSVAMALGEEARENTRRAAVGTDRAATRALLQQTIDELRDTANTIKHPEILSLIDELEAELRSLGDAPGD